MNLFLLYMLSNFTETSVYQICGLANRLDIYLQPVLAECSRFVNTDDSVTTRLQLFTDESVPTISLGLAYYVNQMVPLVPWQVPSLLQILPNFLKRLDRYLGKITKVYSFKYVVLFIFTCFFVFRRKAKFV